VNSLPKTVTRQRRSRLRFEPGPFCARVQHANHSATEPPMRIYNILIIVVVGLPVAARLRVEEVVQSRRPFSGNAAAAVKGSVAGSASAFRPTCFIVTCPTRAGRDGSG